MKVQGSDLIVSIADGGQITYLAAARSCELGCQTNFIQICAPHGEGGWVHNKPTTTTWSVSAECLVADNAYVATSRNAWRNKTKLSLRWYSTDLKDYQKGEAYIANLQEVGSVGDLAKLSISFTPAGALEKATSDSDFPILAGDTLYTNWHFNESTGNFTQTGMELDANGNLVKH